MLRITNKHTLLSCITSIILSSPLSSRAQDAAFSLKATQLPPKYETRAVWITTLNGMDWPHVKANSPEGINRQKEELCHQLDELKKANINTILLQTRLRNEVIYPSSIEIFTEVLTGSLGKDPGYDPLAFAINECHKRGMECHAWVVAIPLGSDRQVRLMGSRSLVKKRSDLCIHHNNHWYLDPGNPETKTYISSIVKEIVTRYDVDGISLDYIRYNDRPQIFPDRKSYRKYGNGKSLNQWRRDNITAIVRSVYETVKAIKPWVKVGSSPIGKYGDLQRFSSRGWNAHSGVMQDAQLWMREGIQDLLLPMSYFRENNFYPFVLDWQENCNGRTVAPGLGIYFLDPSEGNWTLRDAMQQIYFTRCARIPGQAYFRAHFLLNNTQGLLDTIKKEVYVYPALTPPMTWQDSIPPLSPADVTIMNEGDSTVITWKAPAIQKANPLYGGLRYNVYAGRSKQVDTDDPRCLKAVYLQGTRYALPTDRSKDLHFKVTAVDRYGNESKQALSPSPHTSVVPSHQLIDLPSYPTATRIVITDLYGRTVQQLPYNRKVLIQNLEKGVYYLTVQDNKQNLLLRQQIIR